VLALLTDHFYLNERAHRLRERLLTLKLDECGFTLNRPLLNRAIHLWMTCSYAPSARRHQIKDGLNRLLRDWMKRDRLVVPPLGHPRVAKERPLVLVAAEYFNSTHAMYRCYGAWIAQLRRHFELVLLAEEQRSDPVAEQLFNQVLRFSYASRDFPAVVRRVSRLKPDIILYPSLGMAEWSVLMANLRLAPIQCASLGHPATTRSEYIDYVLTHESLAGDGRCFSETLLLLAEQPMMLAHPGLSDVRPVARTDSGVLRVAVSSRSFKLTWPFLRLLARIRAQANRPLEFHFLAGEKGAVHQRLEAEINEVVPGAVVHPMCSYTSYMERLSRCDLHLETFPFGGTNSNMDSLFLGIPVVAMEGDEPHSRIDAYMLRLAGMPEWAIAQDEAGYMAAALRLLDSDQERIGLADALRAGAKRLFSEDPQALEGQRELADTLHWIYRNHEAVQQTGRRLWRPGERPELGPRPVDACPVRR
jgi:hypothetical protein